MPFTCSKCHLEHYPFSRQERRDSCGLGLGGAFGSAAACAAATHHRIWKAEHGFASFSRLVCGGCATAQDSCPHGGDWASQAALPCGAFTLTGSSCTCCWGRERRRIPRGFSLPQPRRDPHSPSSLIPPTRTSHRALPKGKGQEAAEGAEEARAQEAMGVPATRALSASLGLERPRWMKADKEFSGVVLKRQEKE